MKHALWLRLLALLTGDSALIQVIDTHAGAGLYDLRDQMAQRSREAEAGIARLMADPAAPELFTPLKTAVAAENHNGALRYYPGSPLLTARALRRGDSYLGCELRADDQATLQGLLDGRTSRSGAVARAILADGYSKLGDGATASNRSRPVYLIDPPFERGDEYQQIISGVDRALNLSLDAVFAIWAPLKDLETFDALLRGLEALRPPSLLTAETRLRPLSDPMKMNGSAMVFIGAPDMAPEAETICDWVVRLCGEKGGAAKVRRLAQ
jgi:23S rRNA (adenine2030-N6)-methyltransferase